MRNLLTVSQQGVLQTILDPLNLRVFIEGTAGTGKTFLAMAAASELRGRILYICFNRVLARYIHSVMPERKELQITHFHKISDVVLGRPLQAKRQEGETESDFWNRVDETLLGEVRKLKPGTYPLFDAIIVDEAQDLTKTQLKVLMRFCNSRGGKVILFSDAEQNIYRDRLNEEALRSIFRDLKTQRLSVNLRNPKPVVEYCRNIVPSEKQVKIVLNGPAIVRRELKKSEVNAFLKDEVFAHYNPRDVAVISPEAKLLTGLETGTAVSFYGPDDSMSKTEKNLKAWSENRCAWKSTTHAFKGLEAMAVVHLLPQSYASDAIKYVGASRATFQLYLLTVIE
jgi:DNA helicase IV